MNAHRISKAVVSAFLATAAAGATACSGGFHVGQQSLPTVADIKQKLGIDDVPYIRDDTFIGNPLALLGQVIEIRKKGATCPATAADGAAQFTPVPVSGFEVDEQSILKSPSKREAKIINRELAASVSFFGYLSAELQGNAVFSVVLFDMAAGRVNDKTEQWPTSVSKWMKENTEIFADASVCWVVVVKGVVQKNVIRRLFTEQKGRTGGGAYGVNVGGTYMASDEDYSVDVKFGLSGSILKRPDVAAPTAFSTDWSDADEAFFTPLQHVQHSKTL